MNALPSAKILDLFENMKEKRPSSKPPLRGKIPPKINPIIQTILHQEAYKPIFPMFSQTVFFPTIQIESILYL